MKLCQRFEIVWYEGTHQESISGQSFHHAKIFSQPSGPWYQLLGSVEKFGPGLVTSPTRTTTIVARFIRKISPRAIVFDLVMNALNGATIQVITVR